MERSQGRLYWITGLSGAGKTTIGTQLYYSIKEKNKNIILLDGDLLKTLVDDVPGYTNEERLKRAYKYARICKALVDQGLIVVCCTIAMYEEVRKWNRKNNEEYIEVFLDVPREVLKSRDKKDIYKMHSSGKLSNVVGIDMDVDFPKNPDITIVNDGSLTVSECVEKILSINVETNKKITDDSAYWNAYYKKQAAPIHPSSFAEYISKYLDVGKKLVDLGCGNGRDTKYFGNYNLSVIGVDSAKDVIDSLKETNEYDNVVYVNDDFTLSKILFQQNFDYCYSRFTMHAINKKQQDALISNVYTSLCKGGYFFVEARTVNDSIYGLGMKVENEENAYIYEDHYRRFIDINEFSKQLKDMGFEIVEAMESKDFSKYGDSNPTLMRVIARK